VHKLSQRLQAFLGAWNCSMLHFDCLLAKYFLCLLSIKKLFRDIFVIQCPGGEKDLEHTV